MEDLILKEMDECGAEGVDFVPITFYFEPLKNTTVYLSMTREEWLNSDGSYPKTGRVYWKIINGQKIYIDKNQREYKNEKVNYRAICDNFNNVLGKL